jgi:hypothetical protein
VKGIVLVGNIVIYRAAILIPRFRDIDISGSIKYKGSFIIVEGSYIQGKRVYVFCYYEVK